MRLFQENVRVSKSFFKPILMNDKKFYSNGTKANNSLTTMAVRVNKRLEPLQNNTRANQKLAPQRQTQWFAHLNLKRLLH